MNAVAWSLWFLAVVALPLTSRNPLYLGLLMTVVIVVFLSLPKRGGRDSAWRLFAYIGSGVALLSIAFNVLTVHVGDREFARLPDGLPIVGGSLTLNALLYGVISAMAISTVLFAAATFNSAVRHADLVRMLPGSLSRFGVAAGIALLFVPQTVAAARDIYDAQRARGHSFRGLSDARAFVSPLLTTGLERALLLSEALETRGFGSSAVAIHRTRSTAMTTGAASLGIVIALLAFGLGHYVAGLATLAASLALLLRSGSGQTSRSRYRTLEWTPASVAASIGGVVALMILLPGRALVELYFAYDTFPRIDQPGFSPFAGAAILLLTLPAILRQP